ncbi:hypothetical protein JAAARDRAFT_36463 [Jaapia argillacea MUCL 33604]|uniref:FAD-binding PCMH-type domain-containing protein n=1 Tax=Jaapia argillacea MUCL 33604 TaxID=933084 RepID=A0A067PNC1_9AGAM|nr:hypothetical protein JAAARDRAFT_36463 [Jaapia argillacea MUCL 33604]
MTDSVQSADLADSLYEELIQSIRGPLYRRDDPSYGIRSKLFNGNVKTSAKAVVCPFDAQDVSKIVLFCSKYDITLSVKAGGYGTAGWAVNGELIVDLSKLVDMDIEAPLDEDGGFTSLRDVASTVGKGKGKVGSSAPIRPPAIKADSSKRKRQEVDDETEALNARRIELRSYDNASLAVASFFKGPPLPEDPTGELPRQPPGIRRRLDIFRDGDALMGFVSPVMEARQTSSESNNSTSANSGSSEAGGQSSTDATSPATSTGDSSEEKEKPFGPAGGSDPFGYMSMNPGPSAVHQTPRALVTIGRPNAPAERAPQNVAADPFGYMTAGSGGPSSVQAPFSSRPQNSAARSSAGSSMFSSGSDPFSYLSSNQPAPPIPTLPPTFSAIRSGPILPTWLSHSHHSLPNPVSQAEPIHKFAYVTVGAGKLQKEMDMYTAEHPLEARGLTGTLTHVPYHVPSAAHPVGSSNLILGGFGFLSRLHGLSIDNLVEVEMVIPDGRIVYVSEKENSDLWWGMRGAGPAFGIVTRYKAKAYPVPVVFAGNLIYRFHRATAPSLIKHFRDCVKGAPRELYANVLLTAGPADQDSLVVIQICYVGPKEQGQVFLEAISSWDGERCLLNEVNEKAFLDQQDSVAQVLRAKAGRNWFIRSQLITSLPDEVINQTVMQFADTPIGCTWLFELAGGAITDFEDTCVPKSQREATFTVATLHQWDMDVDDPRCRTSAEIWINETLSPVSTGAPYPSFLGRHEPPSRTMACYGENWGRLCDLKRKYDPTNMFKNTFWPVDTAFEAVESSLHEPPSP